MELVGFDYETYLMGEGLLAPPPICLSVVVNSDEEARTVDEFEPAEFDLATLADGDLDDLEDLLLSVEDAILVGARVAFDLAVLVKKRPECFRRVVSLIAAGKISDVQIREKLLNLAEYGDLKFEPTPDGDTRKIDYKLATLASKYLDVQVEGKTKTDRQGELIEGLDAWRVNYDVLADLPMCEWPTDAVDYSVLDSLYPTLIWRHQADRQKNVQHDIGTDPLATESFRVMVSFCLYLMSANGVRVDPEEHAKIVEELRGELSGDKLNLLVAEGILIPAQPPVPYKNGAIDHEPDCKKRKGECDCPPKLTKGTKPRIKKKRLEEFVLQLAQDHPGKVNLSYSDKGNLKLDKEFLQDHYRLSPVLAQYRHRQSLSKIVTTDLPRMEWPKGSGIPAKILHASFDELKETGRTSSYAAKIYPSWNCQNPHPRVRACIVPPPGYVIYSCDFSGMELGTLAQTCLNLFGESVLAGVINRGWDAHAYLGAYLAFYLDDDFHESCLEECGDSPTGEQLYLAFKRCEDHEVEEIAKFYSHYRTFAKPTGLGYPGGLGPATFVEYAHAIYGIEVDEETAAELREVWHKAFPEMRRYLDHIQDACADPNHHGGFCYLTPLGLYRANASYCAAANGIGLQSPSAEGALLATCSVVEETYGNVGSVLYADDQGERHIPALFIHDELLGYAREDCAHEVAHEVSRLMVEGMRLITPDVTPSAAPVLMLRWNKKAKPVTDKNGRLIPWLPKEES